ncbi:AAA family ATPase, partial [Listeria innocua]|nr:AAA family ATPase [Listeria innocua]
MIFESISIKNFRNFKDIQVTLSNKNVFLGLNNVGKTNFLYAFRFIFDREIRKNNLLDSDFHCKKTDEPIEIVVKIDISDTSCVDSQKLRAKLKGAISSNHDKVFIKLSAEYNKTELLAMPILSWGGDIDNLYEMKQRGYMYDIDYIMNVIYIDSYVDLNKLFKKSIGSLIKNDDNADENIITEIEKTVTSLNSRISSLSGVKSFEERITPEYRKFRDENISVSVKSEIAIKGLYSNIVPYIRTQPDETLYPTSGEGRKKLLVYSIFSLISAEHEEKKINLFLIEEPENHLHKSIQIALSQILFEDNKFNYLFMSTHSPFILYEMNKVNLVRIYNKTKIDSTSEFYTVPQKYGDNKKMLNKGLSEAIFADKVLLVEGPSELILFEKVLSSINPFFE